MMKRLSIAFALASLALAVPTVSWATTATANLAITVTAAIAPGFYVAATGGSDSNSGTLAAPFATLGKCQTTMRGSTVKTCYLRAGTYTPAKSATNNCLFGSQYSSGVNAGEYITLTSSDNNETWSYYPPDGVNSAIIDGTSTQGQSSDFSHGSVVGGPANGVGCAFTTDGTSGVSIIGLHLKRFVWAGIWGTNAVNFTAKYNEIEGLTGALFDGGAVGVICGTGAQITNNYFHDLAYTATEMVGNSTHCNDNATIANNVIKNVCTWPAVSGGGNDNNGGDCGAIYFQDIDNGGASPGTSTNISVTNNYIQDVNISSNGAADGGGLGAFAIYLDDIASNVTATGNVIFGIMSEPVNIHGGINNHFINNVFDLNNPFLTSNYINVYFNQSGNGTLLNMAGNQVENNIFVTGAHSGAGQGYHGDLSPPNPMTISNNFYKNFVGSSIATTGNNGAGSDSSPQQPGTSPLITCWAPVLDPASVTRNSPVNFPGITGGWGPPGFVMPQTGTAPSWPHGC